MQQSKIDSVVNKLIDSVRDKDQGFVLNLASEARERMTDLKSLVDMITHGESVDREQLKTVVERLDEALATTSISVLEQLPPIDETLKLSSGREHTIGDTASFMAFAQRYGNPKKSLVMYDDQQCTLTIDELIERGEREIITLEFTKSDEYNAWTKIIGKPFNHRDLYKSLILWSHTLADPTILESMRTMKLNSTVKHESDLQEDSKSIGFFVTHNKGEELKKFPKTIPITLPLLDQDVPESEVWRTAEIRLDIELPNEPGKAPVFTLLCPEWSVLMRERIRKESDLIADGLEGFPVICGKSKTFDRTPRR